MPNWCNNRLTLKGKPDQLKAFRKKAEGKGIWGADDTNTLDFYKFIPYPRMEHINRDDNKEYNNYGYDWEHENFGTKWGACDTDREDDYIDNGELDYTFNSAWSPPDKAIVTISKLYPAVEFHLEYEECGMEFSGYITVQNGTIVDAKHREGIEYRNWLVIEDPEEYALIYGNQGKTRGNRPRGKPDD